MAYPVNGLKREGHKIRWERMLSYSISINLSFGLNLYSGILIFLTLGNGAYFSLYKISLELSSSNSLGYRNIFPLY